MTREEIRETAILDLMESKGFHRLPTETIVDCVFKSISSSVAIKVDRELPVVCELGPDVDACFGQEVCCEILPKYLPNAGSVSNECYREIIGLAYTLADTIAKTQRDFNAKAGYGAFEPLIKEVTNED